MDNLGTSFARWRTTRRTSESPSQWANPFAQPEAPEATTRAADLAMLALVIFSSGFAAGAFVALQWLR